METEPECYDEPPVVQKPKNKYLPGQRLLKKLNQQDKKKKGIDMKTIESSISDILELL
jgi:hypothetical protein